MKKVLPICVIILIALTFGIGGCSKKGILHAGQPIDIPPITEGDGLLVHDEKVDNAEEEENNVIELKFMSMPVEELSPVAYNANWELKGSKSVFNVAGVEQVLVNLYKKDENEINAILQDKHGFYDLGLSLEGEPERLTSQAKDMNRDGALELVLLADRGTTYKEVRIYTYDGEKWKCILATENLIDADLNNDGLTELITTSMGSLPGYVWIYRWAEQQFEKSDVVQDLGVVYAVLTSIDGKTVIEAGNENNPKYYTYVDGKLLRIN